jgi:hypothetical protein
VGAAGAAVRLRDVVFHRVMAAPTRRRVEVRLAPTGTEWRFEVWSRRPTRRPAPRTRSGTPAAGPGRGGAGPDGRPRAGGAAARTGWTTRPPSRRGCSPSGPRWDNVEHTAVGSDPAAPERLLDLALPPQYAAEVAGHALHPTLLDSATASVREAADGPHLPFLYEDLLVHGDLPARMVGLIRRRPAPSGLLVADVELATPEGEVVAEITGYTMRRVEGTAFLTEPDPVSPARRGPRGGAPGRGGGGVAGGGVRLFTTLAAVPAPGQVAVRPHVGGRPVPLPTALPTAVPAAAAEPASRRRSPFPRAWSGRPVPGGAVPRSRRRPRSVRWSGSSPSCGPTRSGSRGSPPTTTSSSWAATR